MMSTLSKSCHRLYVILVPRKGARWAMHASGAEANTEVVTDTSATTGALARVVLSIHLALGPRQASGWAPSWEPGP